MRRIFGALLAALVAAVVMVPGAALAESYANKTDWRVTYNANGRMVDNFTGGFMDDFTDVQPGDELTLTIHLDQQNDTTSNWYMSNAVLESLETSVAQNAAYTYQLSYVGPGGNSRTIYDSTRVGGDEGSGLGDATEGLEDFFFLDTLSKNQTGQVQLYVKLDGDTQDDSYFNTLGRLKMQFAVEPEPSPRNENRTLVRTGDETNLTLLYVSMVASGAALLALWGYGYMERKKEGSR